MAGHDLSRYRIMASHVLTLFGTGANSDSTEKKHLHAYHYAKPQYNTSCKYTLYVLNVLILYYTFENVIFGRNCNVLSLCIERTTKYWASQTPFTQFVLLNDQYCHTRTDHIKNI